MSSTPEILFDRRGAAGLVTLNRPETLNAVTHNMVRALRAQLEQWRDRGIPAVIFLIGGADGIADALRRRAELVLSFGAATWPHQLVRIMLLEQIYRAMTILSGHPYHRE